MEYIITTESRKVLCPVEGQKIQMVIDCDMIVPDIKPDMDYIIDCKGQAVITDENVFDGRISFKGRMDICVIYYSAVDGGRICSMKSIQPFEDFINADDASSGDYVLLTPVLEHIEYKAINGRKLAVKAILSVMAHIENMREITIPSKCNEENGLFVNIDQKKIKETTGIINTSFKMQEEISMPVSKDSIENIISCDAYVLSDDLKAIDGGVRAMGKIRISLMYEGDSGEAIVETESFEVPYDGILDSSGVREGNIVCGKTYIKNSMANVITDSEGKGKTLMFDCEVAVKAQVLSNSDEYFVCDAYSDRECINAHTQEVIYPVLTGKNKNKTVVKDTIKSENADILKYIYSCGDISYYDVNCLKNTVEINGIADISVICLTESDEKPVMTLESSIPFSQEAEITGVDSDNLYCVNVTVEDIQVNVLNSREIEVSAYIVIDLYTEKMCSQICIEKIEKDETAVNDAPSAAIYVVQNDDTLWDIAKRYKTAKENILSLNNLESEDAIKKGKKLLIVKKVQL